MLITLRIYIKLLITLCKKWLFPLFMGIFYQHNKFDNFFDKHTFVANMFVDRDG